MGGSEVSILDRPEFSRLLRSARNGSALVGGDAMDKASPGHSTTSNPGSWRTPPGSSNTTAMTALVNRKRK